MRLSPVSTPPNIYRSVYLCMSLNTEHERTTLRLYIKCHLIISQRNSLRRQAWLREMNDMVLAKCSLFSTKHASNPVSP